MVLKDFPKVIQGPPDIIKKEIRGMFRRNIEHFLKKHIYEKLGISEMK